MTYGAPPRACSWWHASREAAGACAYLRKRHCSPSQLMAGVTGGRRRVKAQRLGLAETRWSPETSGDRLDRPRQAERVQQRRHQRLRHLTTPPAAPTPPPQSPDGGGASHPPTTARCTARHRPAPPKGTEAHRIEAHPEPLQKPTRKPGSVSRGISAGVTDPGLPGYPIRAEHSAGNG